jgi:LuxR family maltose regulon positive regulatory protein
VRAALATAAELGLAEYRGVAVAYAVAAHVADEPGAALAHARHAVRVVEGNATRLALAYVLSLAADALLDRGEPEGRQLLAEARVVVDGCPDPGLAGRRLARTESRHGLAGAAHDRTLSPAGERLTERELAVLRYLSTQLTQRDIARELYVSLNTVKTHLQATYRKLGVVDRKAAVQAARDLHLL